MLIIENNHQYTFCTNKDEKHKITWLVGNT